MQSFEYINKDWIVSPKARRIYRAAAAISLTLYLCIAAIILRQPIPFQRQLLFLGIFAMAVNGIGMEYFLFRFDDSAALKQIFWFFALFFAPLGPALYCFLVYSRSAVVKASAADGPALRA
jgi:hypothetical protein